MSKGRKPWIIDEYTDRTDLSGFQKWKLRHPDRWAKTKNQNGRSKWAKLTAEERVAKHLWSRYKMTVLEWSEMFEKQDYKCATCLTPIEKSMAQRSLTKGVVDHCHTTGKVRGLLCHHCNRAIGLLKEDKNISTNILEYLNHE